MGDIEQVIDIALQTSTTSSGDNLLGFDLDMVAWLESETDIVKFHDVVQTDDPRRLLVATCTSPRTVPREQLLAEIEDVWQTKLRCRHWATHEFQLTDDEIRMRFVTTSSALPSALCVTSEIIVRFESKRE